MSGLHARSFASFFYYLYAIDSLFVLFDGLLFNSILDLGPVLCKRIGALASIL